MNLFKVSAIARILFMKDTMGEINADCYYSSNQIKTEKVQNRKKLDTLVTKDVKVKKKLKYHHVTSAVGSQVSWSGDQSGHHVMIADGVEEMLKLCSTYMTDEMSNRHFC